MWAENETFRIDHYLGKEMVKNIPTFRFGNPIVENMLNSEHVDNVQISFKEPFGTEGRGGYFDEFGIIRDILQNRAYLLTRLVPGILRARHGTTCRSYRRGCP